MLGQTSQEISVCTAMLSEWTATVIIFSEHKLTCVQSRSPDGVCSLPGCIGHGGVIADLCSSGSRGGNSEEDLYLPLTFDRGTLGGRSVEVDATGLLGALFFGAAGGR